MALQPVDRRKGKQFAKTASRQQPVLVLRTNKQLLPSIMSYFNPQKSYFRRGWYY